MNNTISRKQFLKNAVSATVATIAIPYVNFGKTKTPEVLGHGSHQYKVVNNWGVLDSKITPVKDCHEMVQDSKGRLIMITNETKNNVIIYDKSGKLIKSWGSEYPGGHGLTISKENGEDFLFITDYERHEVIKTTTDGKVIFKVGYPKESGKYNTADQFKPTEVAVAPDGKFYVADGYGEQYVLQYNEKGEFLNSFGGRGNEVHNLKNAHGITVDQRDKSNPVLLVTSREENAVKRYTLDGKYLSTIALPGAYICRPVIDDENVYFAVLVSKMPWDSQSGFVCILDKNNKVVSCPGGAAPAYTNEGDLKNLTQLTPSIFKHPHDVCIDADKNLYIPQWNSGQTYPIKLERV